jgi:predicted RNase H-related nuclease YkuK (DUF458 family)
MERIFRSLGNEKVVDLVPYLKQKLSERDDISIYVGCDSQNIGSKTIYAVVIVLHHRTTGGHVLYSKAKFERIKERFTKLWKEVEISMEIAEYLNSHGIRATYIDIDLNPDPKYASNSVLRAAMGFVESMGYTPRCKPEAVSASYVADKLCK